MKKGDGFHKEGKDERYLLLPGKSRVEEFFLKVGLQRR